MLRELPHKLQNTRCPPWPRLSFQVLSNVIYELVWFVALCKHKQYVSSRLLIRSLLSLTVLIKRFLREGCPNCESFLGLANSTDSVQECTSQVFEGLITLQDTTTSWVARWQRLEGCVPGVYAVKVVGTLPDDVKQNVEDAGARYVPRDGTAEDEDS